MSFGLTRNTDSGSCAIPSFGAARVGLTLGASKIQILLTSNIPLVPDTSKVCQNHIGNRKPI